MVPIGVTHISCHYKNTIEGTGEKRTNTNNMLGVNSTAEREFCNTLCMCRLTLVWILANFYKATGMLTHLPSLWLDPRVMLTRLSATVSGVDCLCPCPVANSNFELLFPTLFSCPVTTSGPGKNLSPKPFVWFHAKTDKGVVCLAGHLHSVTPLFFAVFGKYFFLMYYQI